MLFERRRRPARLRQITLHLRRAEPVPDNSSDKAHRAGWWFFDVDARAGVGNVRQHAAVQFVVVKRHPGAVADRPAALFAFVFAHVAWAVGGSGGRQFAFIFC